MTTSAHAQTVRSEAPVILPLKEKIAYGLGGFGSTIPMDIIGGSLMLFYTVVVGVPASLVGLAMGITIIWDAISDPIMGVISDNTKSRWGRRRPYILFAGPLFCAAFFLMFSPPAGLTGTGGFYYLVVTGIIFYAFSTMFMIPYTALGGEIAVDYNDRTRLFAVRTVLERVANFLVAPFWKIGFLPIFASPLIGFRWTVLVLAIIACASFFVVFFGTREVLEVQKQPRMPVMEGLKVALTNVPFLLITGAFLVLIMGIYGAFPFGSYVNIYYVFQGDNQAAGTLMMVGHWIGQFIALGAIAMWSWVGTRVGKHRTLILGIVFMFLAPLVSWFVYTPEWPWLQLVFTFFLNVAVPAITIFPYAMLADVADLDEYWTGRRREGLYFSAMAFITKIGLAGSSVVVGFGLSLVGFVEGENVQQAPEVITRLRLLFALGPLLFIAAGALLLFFYPLSESRVRRIQRVLEWRRAKRGSSPPIL